MQGYPAWSSAIIAPRYQAFGKQVRILYCPRNGKRESHPG